MRWSSEFGPLPGFKISVPFQGPTHHEHKNSAKRGAHDWFSTNSPLDPVLVLFVIHKTERIIRKSTRVGLVTTHVTDTQPHLAKRAKRGIRHFEERTFERISNSKQCLPRIHKVPSDVPDHLSTYLASCTVISQNRQT